VGVWVCVNEVRVLEYSYSTGMVQDKSGVGWEGFCMHGPSCQGRLVQNCRNETFGGVSGFVIAHPTA